jgi:pyruvate/2-oxoglutarate dehydrogenase complex dihydrolipoamide acyltransferase (E2) component
MSTREQKLVTGALGLAIALTGVSAATAQQARPKAPAKSAAAAPAMAKASAPPAARQPTTPAAPATTKSTTQPAADPAKKAKILNSPRWRRAMFETNEWLSAQPFYSPEQVAQIKADLSERVAKMSASDLEFMLDDMDAKFKVMETKEAQEARAWLAQYLSVLADKKREEVLKEMPNIATMTAAQLSQEIQKIELKRASRARHQAAFDRARAAQVDAVMRANEMAQQNYRRDSIEAPSSYYSPYRTPPVSARQLQGPKPPNLDYYMNSAGGFGFIFSPDRW